MFCSNCGSQLAVGSTFCGNCGSAVRATGSPAAAPAQGFGTQAQVYVAPLPPQRDFVSTWLLSLFFGSLGVDRFYLGYAGIGVAKLVLTIFTGIGGLVWHWVDLVLLLSGRMPDYQGRPLLGYAEKRRMAIAVTVSLAVVSFVLLVALFSVIIAAFAGAFSNYN